MNTKGIRKELNLTAQEFADKFNIPVSTVRNWDSRDCMPKYIFDMVIYICRLEENCRYMEQTIQKLIVG